MSELIDDFATLYPFPPKPAALKEEEKTGLRERIARLLKARNAVIVAHYYTDPEIQALAEATGGCVADSLEMARFGSSHPATTLLVAGCPEAAFSAFCDAHPDRTVVVYANTSAAVKARADWVVTSSIAVELIDHLDSLGEKIIWAPDRHLGRYVQKQTGADMLCWQSACIVHDEFKTQALRRMKRLYPDAAVLVHPESPQAVVDLADAVGSTSQLIQAAKTLPQQQMIVATDRGIFFKMQQACPEKTLLAAPTAGEGATCRSCAHCPWMAMNGLKAIAAGLERGGVEHEIRVEEAVRQRALVPLNRMLAFAADLKRR